MKKNTALYASLMLSVVIVTIAGFMGCKSSDDFRQSRKGEACQVTNDAPPASRACPFPVNRSANA